MAPIANILPNVCQSNMVARTSQTLGSRTRDAKEGAGHLEIREDTPHTYHMLHRRTDLQPMVLRAVDSLGREHVITNNIPASLAPP